MTEIKKLENSLVEIKGEISAEILESNRAQAVKKLSEKVNIDGFRKGHIPENILEKNVGEMAILEEMAQITISKEYVKILKENNIDAIGYPNVSITKLAKGNPLGFTITVATLPEVKLPDYKKLAKEINKTKEEVSVEEVEIETALKQIKIMRAKESLKEGETLDENNLPEIDEEYLKKLGDFKNLEDLKEKISENIKQDKEFRATEKNRLKIIEEIIKESGLVVPEILINSETEKIRHKIKSDIEGMGLNYEDYLKHLQKTEDDMRKEWRSEAEKRAKMQLLVSEIAKEEKLSPEKDKVESEVKKIKEIYKDVEEENARYYVESVLINEEVFKFLENQK